jgi:hypothetical protein
MTAGWDYSKPWYHGSPFTINTIRKGSTITQDRDLARVFSHKPTLVSISDDGAIEHDGKEPGFLYRVAEEVKPSDVRPHPRSSMEPGKEWLTNRELRVALVAPTEVIDRERLTEADIADVRRRSQSRI